MDTLGPTNFETKFTGTKRIRTEVILFRGNYLFVEVYGNFIRNYSLYKEVEGRVSSLAGWYMGLSATIFD